VASQAFRVIRLLGRSAHQSLHLSICLFGHVFPYFIIGLFTCYNSLNLVIATSSGLAITTASDLDDAAIKAVAALPRS
jgi:hypothetical protein